jgi:hypothetical protein
VRNYLRIWNTDHEFAPNASYTKLSLSFPKGSLSTVHFPYLFQKGPFLLYIFLFFSKRGPIYCTLSLSFPKGSLSTINFPYLFQKGPYLQCTLSLSFPKGALSRLSLSFRKEALSRLFLSFPKEALSRLFLSFPTEGPSRLSLSFQKGPYLNFPYRSQNEIFGFKFGELIHRSHVFLNLQICCNFQHIYIVF